MNFTNFSHLILTIWILLCGEVWAQDKTRMLDDPAIKEKWVNTLQVVLEMHVSGKEKRVFFSENLHVSLVPLATWKSVSDHYCRRFKVELITQNEVVDREYGVYCRDMDKIWKNAKGM